MSHGRTTVVAVSFTHIYKQFSSKVREEDKLVVSMVEGDRRPNHVWCNAKTHFPRLLVLVKQGGKMFQSRDSSLGF